MDNLFGPQQEGLIISGKLGDEYRRLKLLDLLRAIERSLDPKKTSDVEDYKEALSLRKKLQGPVPKEMFTFENGFGLKLPKDEWEVVAVLSIYTSEKSQWMWRSEEEGEYSLHLEDAKEANK